MSECKHEWYLKAGRGYLYCGVCGKTVPVENHIEYLESQITSLMQTIDSQKETNLALGNKALEDREYAELGRLAANAIDIHADNVGCIGVMNEDCPTDRRKCGWYEFCQKRAELLAES